MKKTTAILLSLFLFFTVFAPGSAFAQNDKELEQVIKIAREKLSIPESFQEFDYSMNIEQQRKIWYLNWNSKNVTDGSISVSINDLGTILNYHYYKPYTEPQSRLPKITKQEAVNIAKEFIKKINPEYLEQIKYMDNNRDSVMDMSYFINFTRVINDIPLYQNNIEVHVNRQTGEVQYYYFNWTEDVEFPKAENIIQLDEAQKAYKEKLGLKLIYKYTYDSKNKKANTYLVYVPVYNRNNFIDAFTGEKIDLGANYYDPYYYGMGGYAEKSMARSDDAANGNQIILTPEELNAIKEASIILSQEAAEKKAKEFKYLELTDEYKVNYANLYKEYVSPDTFIWNLNFTNEDINKKGTDNKYRTVNVTLDAKSGEIKSFYTNDINDNYNENNKAKYDKESAKAEVEKFLKSFKPDAFSQTEYDELYEPIYRITSEDDKPKYFNFRYTRKVNGISFPDNGFTVGFDAVTGKITNFGTNWYNIDFASAQNVIGLDKAYESLFSKIGIELQYKIKYPDKYWIMSSTEKPEPKLVYAEKPEVPVIIDANSGAIVDYNGKPYKPQKASQYTDIEGHFAEKYINTLAELGIYLEGTEFKPDENITQLDFFILLSSTIDYYRPYPLDDKSELIEQMYANLIREGIVKEEEKAPEAVVTREEAVKYIIRALKFNKVADIKGIYHCPFKDVDQINPELIGYVTIAGGLGIINAQSEYFNPKDNLTRAQAAIIIYNYLQH